MNMFKDKYRIREYNAQKEKNCGLKQYFILLIVSLSSFIQFIIPSSICLVYT